MHLLGSYLLTSRLVVNYATVGGKKTLLQDFDKMYPGKWSTAPDVVTPFSDCVDAVCLSYLLDGST